MAAAPMTAASVRSPRSASAAQVTSPATQPSPTGSHPQGPRGSLLARRFFDWSSSRMTASHRRQSAVDLSVNNNT
ncbi:hypothetical protein EJ06DRAFT_255229 [Trichodelitschia bisporula]|uniref:Uncharacterized protein n=1 Tax=Trichodelitschia bisporula TaxID=703511 RepID=A0A6G1HIK3_9PEZI|nr:hypothetical protein EJ06DRAFT_255229 [Trichodelitschia bisporula]